MNATYIVNKAIIWSVDVMDENAVKTQLSGGTGQDLIDAYKSSKHYNTAGLERQDMADRYGTILDRSTTDEVKDMYQQCFTVQTKANKPKKEMVRMLANLLANREK